MAEIKKGDSVIVVNEGVRIDPISDMLGIEIKTHYAELGEIGTIVDANFDGDPDWVRVDFGRFFEGSGNTLQVMKKVEVELV